MKKLLLLSTLLIVLTSLGQKKSSLPDIFYSCWSASYEENKEGSQEKLYRPCDHQFPMSRFRQSIVFDKNGTCKVLHVGETDAHYYVDCKWTYDKKKKILDINDDKGKVKMKMKLVSVDKQTLKFIFID
ncbi:MAG: hypothetical protein JWO32_3084 [Bacteroidetes bacterium]|nr:hypothetical protein [Bacteroidota bacterium]